MPKVKLFIQHLIALSQYLFHLKSFDTSSLSGRSKERYRRIALSTIVSFFSKFSGLIASIISVPLTINYLGVEQFGIWMTLSSFLTILNFTDLGLGNGLVNLISKALGNDDNNLVHGAVSSAFYLLLILSFTLLVILSILSPLINWSRIYKITDPQLVVDAAKASILFVALCIVRLPFSVVQKVLDGYQEGFTNNFYQIIGNVAGLAGMIFVINFKLGLFWLVFSFGGIPLLLLIVTFIIQLYFVKPSLKPKLSYVSYDNSVFLFKTGLIFFLLNILTIAALHIDNLLISYICGASSVSEYAIVMRLSRIAFLYWTFIEALWPAYGEALARNDYQWVRKTIKRSLGISCFGGIGIGLIITLSGQPIIKYWTGAASIIPSRTLLIGTAVYILLNGFVGCISVIGNAGFLLKKQIFPLLLTSICAIILKIYILKNYEVGLILWGTIISYIIFYIIPMSFIIRKDILRKAI